jgi:predicted porin
MKKTLLAAAVLAACAGTVSAQTNVTIYGLVDIGVAREDNGAPAGAAWRLDSGIQSGSRLGFRGTENLGGGLSAIFVLENGFNTDTGALGQGGRLFGRQSYVGLNGGFGSIRAGRQYNPIHNTLDLIDPFGTGLAGDITRGWINNYGTRTDNTLSYTLPEMGGFNGQVLYGLGEVAGSNRTGSSLGLNAGYAQGPINVQLAHHRQTLAAAGTGATATGAGDVKTTMLGGTYDFKIAKAHAAYAVNKGDRTGALLDTRDMMLGVSVPVGAAGTILADYIRKNDRRIADADSSMVAVGYLYSLSKRTNLYTSYSRTENDRRASVNAAAPGATDTLFNVGVRHKF